MPAYATQSDSLGAKLVTLYSQQVEGIPSHQGIVIVLDPRTGSLQAVSDGWPLLTGSVVSAALSPDCRWC